MSNLSSVLSELDWDEGLTIPVANATNKALEDEVQRKHREVITLQNDVSSNDNRVHAMNEHLRNIRQELQHTQNLVNARKHEVETEDHMVKIASREEGRLQHELQRLEKEVHELKEKKNVFENNIFKQTQKLEELKSRMNWDQQALEAWLEESARKDEDSMTLIKYTRQDEAKIKELSLRIEHMTEDSQKRKKLLDHETMETHTAQIELDKTAEEFRKAHQERQHLINQWEQTIDQMQRRDQEMDLLAQRLVDVKLKAAEKEAEIKDKERFYEDQLQNNQDFEKKIGLAERNVARVRLEYQETEQQRDQFQSELDALKRTVDRTAIDLENTRSSVSHLKQDIVEKQRKLENAKHVHEDLIDKLKGATETTLSAEERAARMDELMVEEERKQKEIDQELKRLRELQFRRAQELSETHTEERNTEAEIQGSRAAIRNLNSKVNKLDHDSLKQQEIIYTQDFEIQKLERRINRMQGEQSNEEKLTLESRIRELTEELDNKIQTHNLLDLQLKRLQDDVRRVKRDLEANTGQQTDLTSKIEELNLHNDTSQQELKRLTSQKQNLMVDENILKLELRRMREILNSRSDSVLSLEKRRLQLETAMKERQQEINIHIEMLQSQVRAADTERSQISSELHERISKIDKLRKRYDILMVSMAPPEGEEDKSQAYYVIKAAQDKEEMQREGDELDAKIRKAEKEIRALENTIRLMNNRNETYRKSFNKVTDTSDEMDEKQQLDEQLRAVMDKYKYKRRQIRELQEDLQTMGSTLDSLDRDESAYVEMMEERQGKVMQLSKDLDDQKAKIDRVAKLNAKHARELRSAKKIKGETDEERDFEVRELRELNKTAVKQIGDAVQQNPDIAQAVHLYFSQSNIPMPSTPGSTPSSRTSSLPGSARSSLSSSSKHSGVASVKSVEFTGPQSPARSSSSHSSARSGRSQRR